MSDALARAQSLGSYEVVRKLGAGGMAEVFLAMQRMAGDVERLVVIKSILPTLAADDRFVQMFLREARIAAVLTHPNIVRIHDVAIINERPCIVMEFLRGRDLAFLLRRVSGARSRIEPEVAAAIVAQAAAGLHYAHTKRDERGRSLGLVHRDVSPHNIVVTREGQVVVLDFGIAKSARQREKTETGTIKGKLGYMAPEYLKGAAIDGRADQFALGVVLWESLTARRLFSRPDHFQTMEALFYKEVPPPSAIAGTPPELDDVVLRALERDPERRFASCEILASELRAWVAKMGASADAQLVADWVAEVVPPSEDDDLYGPNPSGITLTYRGSDLDITHSDVTVRHEEPPEPEEQAAPPKRLGTVTLEPPAPEAHTREARPPKRLPSGETPITGPTYETPGRRKPRWIVPALGVVLGVVALGVAGALVASLVAEDPEERPVVRLPSTIEVRFARVPEGARVEVDGQLVLNDRIALEPSDRTRVVRVSVDDRSEEYEAVFERDTTFALRELPRPPQPATAPPAQPEQPPPAPIVRARRRAAPRASEEPEVAETRPTSSRPPRVVPSSTLLGLDDP